MATKSFYLTATFSTEGCRQLSETTQAAVTNADGWVVSTGATLHSEYESGIERAATTFTGTTVPDGTIDTILAEAFRSTNAYSGTFAAGNWTFTFVVRPVTSASGQAGRVRFRVLKGTNGNGSGATEITSAQQQGTLTGAMSVTTSDFTSSLTVSLPAITLVNQYLFIQIAWERTTAGSMSTADVNWRTGSSASLGTRIITTDFTVAAAQAVTGTTIAAGSTLSVPSVAYGLTGTAIPICDSYSGSEGSFSGDVYVGQTFVGNGQWIVAATFRVSRQSTGVTGTVQALIYATTGVLGTTAKPTGSPLATSATVDVSAFPIFTSAATQEFVFTGSNSIGLTAGTTYALVCKKVVTGGLAYVTADLAGTHVGNFVSSSNGSTWAASSSDDVNFSVTTTSVQLFAPTVTPAAGADQAVTGTLLAASSQLFAPTVAAVSADQAVVGGTLSSTAALTVPSVTPGAVTLTGAMLASTATITAPTVAPGAVTVQLPALSSTAVVRVPSVATGAVTLLGATRATTAVLTAPTVAPQAVTITGASIATSGQRFAPTVATGPVTVIGATLATAAQLFVVTVAVGPSALLGSTIASSALPFAPTVVPGAVTVTLSTIASSAALFTPTVTPGQRVTLTSIATTASLTAPTLVPGPVSLTTGTVPFSSQVFLPLVSTGGTLVLTAHIPTAGQRFAPIVMPSAVSVTGATLAASSAPFALTVGAAGAAVTRAPFGYIITTS